MLNFNLNKNPVRQIAIARSWLNNKTYVARSNRHDKIAVLLGKKEFIFDSYRKAMKFLVEKGFAEVWKNIPARRVAMFKNGFEDIVLNNGSIATIYPLGN